jgi:hypothetical protein
MQVKLKKCSKCGEQKQIWKRHNRELYCKDCWAQHPDKGKKPLQAKKPISKKSSKQEKLDALYSVLRETYLKANPFCKAKLHGCQINATDVHHMAGRGKFMLDQSTFLAVCRICHNQIEENPVMAKAMGFSESREEAHGNKEQDGSPE